MIQFSIQIFLNLQLYFLQLEIILITLQDGELFSLIYFRILYLKLFIMRSIIQLQDLDGRCISYCQNPYQKLIGQYCQDYDDQTPYSKYLIQEYTSQANDPDQYQKYTLIFQNGSNFLKGSDIYYSQWQYYRVFGGPFVWAQAKFQRIHNIIEPHHSITIAFYIVYGPQFQSDGRFIYTIENNEPVSKSSASYFNSYPDGSKFDKVYEQIEHYKNSLTIYWECFGQNNEPVYAYCGFYNYYIVVHYCQPYCLECLDWNTCQQWNSTYDSNIVRFSQKDCLTTQYFDRDSLKCLNCPLSCQTCTSKIDCQTCQPTYIQTKLGCICKINQYEDENQCFDCPIECNQCLSSTYCIECLSGNYREFKNGQCNCIDGYYPIVSNPQCQLCHKFCKICSGPTSNDCLTCNDIFNIEKIGSICRCPTGSYYQDAIKACSPCHSSCLTCFRRTIDGCLTCDHNLNRILKELKCTCVPGYYELSNICTNCPNMEDVSLIQCYKQCNDNQQIWHTRTCNFCDLGYQLVSGECQPICGDLQIKSYEQCEDNNTNFDDLCYNCQFQCPNHCQICDQSTTLPCPDVCGDGIITGVEECEDGNTIQYDGCFNCKYQCQPSCTKCIKGQCFECVTGGWYLDITVTPWQCKEKCGDELIVGNEQCEDGNLIDTDGCKDCKYFCRTGFFLAFTFTSYQCKNVCGDGLVVTDPNGFFSEECDDGNTKNDDGCSSSCQFQCQSSTICTSCLEDRCDICATGYNLSSDKICNPICEDAKIVLGEQCETSFILPYKGCINCKVKCQGSCNQCDTTGLGCLQCQKGYNRIDYLCYSVCGDQIVTNDEDCDDGNLIIGDGCHFCQFSCQDSCLNCIQGVCFDCQEGYEFDKIQQKCNLKEVPLSFCQFQLKLSPYLHCHYCFENCETCNENNCIRCQSGYYLDNNFTCISSCGDGIVAENEECEIINSINGYECQNCQIQCQSECINCIKGICFTCEEIGWEIDLVSRECKPICGDGLVVGKEQCDDRNEIDWDGCSQCQYLCQQQCTKCFQEFCLECNFEGWYLYEKRCITNCGDGVIAGNEQCDDQNTIPFDGCYDCQLECQVQCTDCRQGVCYECAIQGWEIKNQSCQPICGDGIVIKDLEECDDGNIILFDGCYECQFECSNGCLKCQQKQCVKCLDNLYQLDAESQQCVQVNLNLNNQDIDLMNQNIIHYQNLRCGKNKQLIDNICVSLCGNGLIENEECDDGNFIGGDGCSSFCHVEDSYQCINENGTYSVCTFILAPEFNLNILSDISNSTQIVELTFSQQVKVLAELPIEEIIQFVITPETKHELILRAFQNITINLKNPKYQVLIEFHEPVSNPVLQVYANKNIIINQFDLSLDINEKYINLGTPYVLPQSTRQSLTSIIQFNGAMMYSMASISSLALITGNTIIFFNLLDLLQSLSYLKFMLYQFPPHLRNFLNTYTKVSLQPIFDYIGVDSYLIKLQGMSTSNQVNQIRNQDPQNILNQNYIFNAKGCYFSVIASILTYIIYCILISQRVERLIIKLSNKYQNNLKMIQIIRLFQKKVQKKCLISKIEYLSVGVFRVYYAILHQFMFSVSLQFPNYKFDTSFEIFNSVNAICGLLFIVIANIQLLSITSSKIKNESKWKYFYQESKTHFWALQLKSFQIYRILFYILIIVKLIDYPEAQSILLSIQSFLFLTYLIKFKPQKCVFEMVKLICREFLLIIIIGSFLIYSFEFSQESLILIGWIHIGLFCTILAINLFLDVLQQIWKTYDNYCQKKIKKEKNEQMKK
ncbi:unnamed protein product [Paramecium sonneborni]|uniref:Uncharacterized protein n=1 Tax=Paramecium sonneborni TaxID=65129 RepID=A0A8S1PEB1_9CILI|nr:unnamed protein product [Paramecium sonneborni]